MRISLRDLSVSLAGASILDKVTLEIEPGSIVAVVGLSGSGKTTLLKAIAGLLDPSTATVTGIVSIVDQTGIPRSPEIGMAFQRPFLFPWTSAINNVRLSHRLHRSNTTEAEAQEAMEMVGMLDESNKYPRQLSGGMQQRVALAREFARRPDVLLLDEPFSSLDCITKEQLCDSLLEFWYKRRSTIVLVTHDPRDAAFLSDEVLVLRHGVLQKESRKAISFDRPRSSSLGRTEEFHEVVEWIIEELRSEAVGHP
ncbi:MAG TPA: ABC transporter ATP-binding protein [Schlesneria sp.]